MFQWDSLSLKRMPASAIRRSYDGLAFHLRLLLRFYEQDGQLA
jgi:hypothetical protein